MPPAAHHRTGFILGLQHPFRASRLNVDSQVQTLPVFAIPFQERPDGDVSKVVLGLSEDGSDRLSYANYLETRAIDVDCLADGINRGKKLFRHVLSDERDLRSAVIVSVRYVAAGFGFLHIHVSDVGRDSTNINVVQRLCSQPNLAVGSRLQADGLRQPHTVPQSFEVFPSD